jgi:hypothetical protein
VALPTHIVPIVRSCALAWLLAGAGTARAQQPAPPVTFAPPPPEAEVSAPLAPVVAVELHRAPGVNVTSIDLSSGVRLLVRPARRPSTGEVHISALVPGVELLESPGERGLFALAAASMDLPGPLAWTVRASPEGLVLRCTAPPGRAGEALAQLQGALTRPALSAERFRAKLEEQQRVAAFFAQPAERQVAQAMLRVIAHHAGAEHEPSLRPPGAEVLGTHTQQRAHDFLARALAQRPVDIALITPDVPGTIQGAREALASLPARARDRMIERRTHSPRPPAPGEHPDVQVLAGRVPPGQVLLSIALPAPPITDLASSRAMLLAGALLEQELRAAAGDVGGQVVLVTGVTNPGRVFPSLGHSVGTLMARLDAGQAEALAQRVAQRLEALLESPVEEARLAVVRAEQVSQLESRVGEDEYWLSSLPASWFLGVSVDDLAGAPGAVRAATPEGLRRQLSQCWRAPDGRPLAVIVVLTPGGR